MATPHQAANALGIDVAHYDGDVDWQTVLSTAGRSFGFVKVTEGAHTIDSKFDDNWTSMGEVGITRGVYHLFRSNVDPGAQADHFLSVYADRRLSTDMPPSLDIETEDGVSAATRIDRAQTWLDRVETALGVRPLIYTFPSFWSDSMDSTHHFSDAGYLLWLARFSSTATTPDPLPGGWSTWTFWQYASGESGRVHVPGVSGAVDADRFNGSHDDLIELFGLSE